MNRRTFWPNSIAFIVVASLLTSACSSKSSNTEPSVTAESKNQVKKEYKVYGDPIEIIAGTHLSTNGLFKQLKSLKSLYLFSYVDFSEKPELTESDLEYAAQDSESGTPTERNIEDEEAPVENYTPPEAYHLKIKSIAANKIKLSDENFNIVFIQNQDIIEYEIDEKKGRVLHFSITPDSQFISILIYGYDSDADSKELTALYFSKKYKPTLNPKKTSQPFSFSEGASVITQWPQQSVVSLSVCGAGSMNSSLPLLAEQLVPLWNSVLNSAIEFKITKSEKSLPFSDLNQKCIYLIENRIEELSPRIATFANTISVTDYNNMVFIDSDILIFKNEYEKIFGYFESVAAQKTLQVTLLHELGHILGLDHVFNKNIKSIMSYDPKIQPYIYPYDIEAIRALYNNPNKKAQLTSPITQ